MSNEQLKFWIKCPDCRKPFGVDPRFIVQYLNRVLDAKMTGAARTTANQRAESSAPKAPYKTPYRKGGYGKPAYR